jgi:hypothetical protein
VRDGETTFLQMAGPSAFLLGSGKVLDPLPRGNAPVEHCNVQKQVGH